MDYSKKEIGETWYREYNLPIDIHWDEDDHAHIDIGCDACSRDYKIITTDIEDLHLCSFCGHYLDMPNEEETNESQENSWN